MNIHWHIKAGWDLWSGCSRTQMTVSGEEGGLSLQSRGYLVHK